MGKQPEQSVMEERVRGSLTYRTIAPDSIGAMLDFEYVDCSAERGELTLKRRIEEPEINIYGTLHGGIITWLMDSTMGILGRAYTGYETIVTMDIHTNFLRAIYAGEEVIIKARVTYAGSRVVNSCSEMYVGDKLCATADAIFYNVN